MVQLEHCRMNAARREDVAPETKYIGMGETLLKNAKAKTKCFMAPTPSTL